MIDCRPTLRRALFLCFFLVLGLHQAFAQVCATSTCDEPLQFQLNDIDGELGDIIPVEFLVCGFDNILAFQFGVTYNPNDLRITQCDPGSLATFNCSNIQIDTVKGLISTLWFDQNTDPQSLFDEAALFVIYFEIIGDPDAFSMISISEGEPKLEFSVGDPADPTFTETLTTWCQEGGNVNIQCPTFEVFGGGCAANDAAGTSFEFFNCGGNAPYEWRVTDITGTTLIAGPDGQPLSGIISTDFAPEPILGLDPGTQYLIQITDADNVRQQDTILIPVGDPLSIDIRMEDPRCAAFFFTTGRAIAEVTGGSGGGYEYRWSHTTLNSERVTDLAPGSYSLTVEDSNGCETSESFEIVAPQPVEIELVSVSGPACGGMGSRGTVTISATGGNPQANGNPGQYQYNFNSNTGAFDIEIAGNEITYNQFLTPGEWTVFVLDQPDINLCPSDTITFTVPASTDFEFTFSELTTDCDNGLANVVLEVIPEVVPLATIALTSENGDPFPLSNSNFSNSGDRIEGIPPGTYIMDYRNGDGCTAVDSFTVVAGSPLTIDESTLIISQPGCGTGPTGSVDFSVAGGTGDLSYSWSDGVETTVANRSDLAPDVYNVTVTDPSGCPVSLTDDFVIMAGDGLSITRDQLDISQPICNGDLGALTIITTGDSPPLVLDLGLASGPEEGTSISDIPAGSYSLIISLASDTACSVTIDNIDFIDTAPFTLGTPVFEGPACEGPGNDGQIEVLIEAGDGPFTYLWNDGNTENPRTDLVAGDYNVTVSNATGCERMTGIALSPQTDGPYPTFVLADASCEGVADGSIVFEDAGDRLTFTWPGGIEVDDRMDLEAGIYLVTASIDTIEGCVQDSLFVIGNAGEVEVEFDAQLPACAGQMGFVIAEASGGTAPYAYSWDVDNDSGIDTLPNVPSGDYTVNVMDANGCLASGEYTLIDGGNIDISEPLITPPLCKGVDNGIVTISANGGDIGSFNFIWSSGEETNGVNTATAMAVSAGQQFVIITDGMCRDSISFTVPAGDSLRYIRDPEIRDAQCFGDASARIVLDVIGGTDNYNYSWSHDPTVNSNGVIDIGEGTYTVTITDDNGCELIDSFVVGSPPPFEAFIDLIQTQDISCFDAQGLITVGNTGGIGTLTYEWPANESVTQSATNLGPGEYIITVTDENGCQDTAAYTLTASEEIFFDIADFEDPLCAGGQACVGVTNVQGGVGNFRFSINNGPLQTAEDCVPLFAGDYSINVFDAAGCNSTEVQFSIMEPSPPSISIGQDTTVELGESLRIISNVTSLEGVDFIIWAGDFSFRPLTADATVISIDPQRNFTINATLVDNNGCTAQAEIDVTVRKSRNIFIPNVFYPNAPNNGTVDLRNTRFSVFTGRGVEAVESIQVFDRWGSLLYESGREEANTSGIGLGSWDGTFNGQRVVPGVYSYIVEVLFSDDQQISYKGNVTVLN